MGKLNSRAFLAVVGLCFHVLAGSAVAASSLNWNTNQNSFTVDIKSEKLLDFLEQLARTTRWHIFVEPNISHNVSAKFTNLKMGDALGLLLGDLNFALVPGTNAPSRLYVFETERRNATLQVSPFEEGGPGSAKKKIIPNELIVRLKPGANIDEIARLVGAKVAGKIAGLNAYRLVFEDEEAANAARTLLADNSEVASVENNYYIDRPPVAMAAPGMGAAPLSLKLNPPPESGQIVVGLIDTAIQPLCNNMDVFIRERISVGGQSQIDPTTPMHATSMAEAMLRGMQAVAKNGTSAQIIAVDVYGANPSSSTFDVAQGIVQAVNKGANVINLSLGGQEESPVLHDVIKSVAKLNIPVFGAAGNQPVTTPFYPAAYPEVTAVTAVDRGQYAPYANRGDFIELAAPGAGVFCFNGQSYMGMGTSTSAAFTSGLAAGYLSTTGGGVQQMQRFLQSNLPLPKP